MTAPFHDSTKSTWGIAWQQHHVDFLTARGVSRDVAYERGYKDVQEHSLLERAGFSRSQTRQVPGLLIPMRNAFGKDAGYQYRPDKPRTINGKAIKYETRKGQPLCLDVPARVQPVIGDPTVPLWITEGPVKADAAVTAGLMCIALTGVWNFRGKNTEGGKTVLGDFDAIAFNGRQIILAFDSDSTTKVQVYAALERLSAVLEGHGAHVSYCHLPDVGDVKVGLDDYLAQGHGVAELEALVDDDLGPRPTPPETEDVGVDGHHFTDLGNAQRLVAHHGDEIRFVPAWGTWMAWDGARFAPDHSDVRVLDLATDVPRRLFAEAAEPDVDRTTRDKQLRWAKQSESLQRLTAAVRLARSIPGVAVGHDDLDGDPWLLNVENGVIDLRTGVLHDHDPGQLMTKLAPVRFELEQTAPAWESFLETILPDPDVRSFLQRAVGYSLTGDVTEQVFLILTGVGRNGKSTALGAIAHVLGDYAVTAPKDLLLAGRHEPHPTSMTRLFGARFASAVETERGVKLAEAQVKQLVGGDKITARRMREDFWEFDPTHKLWLGCNHLPRIDGRDLAIWRRIRVVPFNVVVPEGDVDRNLGNKLRAESSGILAWAVQGCLDWQREGLESPDAVKDATKSYRHETDWLTRFLADKDYELTPGFGSVVTKVLWIDFGDWCRDERITIGRQEFTDALKSAGCTPSNTGGVGRMWKGMSRA